MVIFLQDEEGVNFRASNLAAGPLHLRSFSIPEAAHPLWNDTSRALQASRLKGPLLRGTVLCNHFKGPFRSGRRQFDLTEAAYAYLRDTPEDVISLLSKEWAADTGFPGAVLTPDAFLNAPGIQTRLPAVTHSELTF